MRGGRGSFGGKQGKFFYNIFVLLPKMLYNKPNNQVLLSSLMRERRWSCLAKLESGNSPTTLSESKFGNPMRALPYPVKLSADATSSSFD
jgi:hypothetical protein